MFVNTVERLTNMVHCRYTGDQDDTEWVHHPWVPGQVDTDHQGGRPDPLRVVRPVAWKGGAHGAHRQLSR